MKQGLLNREFQNLPFSIPRWAQDMELFLRVLFRGRDFKGSSFCGILYPESPRASEFCNEGAVVMGRQDKIDLNSDVGESFGRYKLGLDEEVIPLISSANIACGFHAGDPSVMRRTLSLAAQYGVAPGAHPGFPDLLGFGRRNMDATLEEIKDYVTYQIGALTAFASSQGRPLQHVKPHGALYNMASKDARIWDAVGSVISRLNRDLILVVMAGPNRTELEEIGKRHGIRMAFEFFADRAYSREGTLVSRREPGALIHDPRVAAERVLKMINEGKVTSIEGTEIVLSAETVCVHGDNPAALTLAKTLRDTLLNEGVDVKPLGTFI